MLMNADKCKLLISNAAENVSLKIDGDNIKANKSVKLLGIKIDNQLDFNDHVSTIYKKLVRNYMPWQGYRIL